MKFHKEGIPSLLLTLLFISILNGLGYYFFPQVILLKWLIYLLSLFLLVTILQFFRNPKRNLTLHDNKIIAPADGKVVVIEEVVESEYFKDKRRQISIFMSPINVHVNRYPIAGIVKFVKYHPGLFLVAWHPKSSTDNERTTVVVEHKNKEQILFRQIAGALARRIVCYSKEQDVAAQGSEFGFIKFGSRVDVFLPLSCKINVKLNDVTVGGESVIAEF